MQCTFLASWMLYWGASKLTTKLYFPRIQCMHFRITFDWLMFLYALVCVAIGDTDF